MKCAEDFGDSEDVSRSPLSASELKTRPGRRLHRRGRLHRAAEPGANRGARREGDRRGRRGAEVSEVRPGDAQARRPQRRQRGPSVLELQRLARLQRNQSVLSDVGSRFAPPNTPQSRKSRVQSPRFVSGLVRRGLARRTFGFRLSCGKVRDEKIRHCQLTERTYF